MDGPNPSNPFTTETQPIRHLPSVIEYPWGTISVPPGDDMADERRRLLDSFNGGKKGS